MNDQLVTFSMISPLSDCDQPHSNAPAAAVQIPFSVPTPTLVFIAVFIFRAGAKSEPVQNNYAGCQQSPCSAQPAPMPQQTANETFPRINVKVKTQSAAVLFITVSWSVNTPIHSPSPAWLLAASQKNFMLNKLHLI